MTKFNGFFKYPKKGGFNLKNILVGVAIDISNKLFVVSTINSNSKEFVTLNNYPLSYKGFWDMTSDIGKLSNKHRIILTRETSFFNLEHLFEEKVDPTLMPIKIVLEMKIKNIKTKWIEKGRLKAYLDILGDSEISIDQEANGLALLGWDSRTYQYLNSNSMPPSAKDIFAWMKNKNSRYDSILAFDNKSSNHDMYYFRINSNSDEISIEDLTLKYYSTFNKLKLEFGDAFSFRMAFTKICRKVKAELGFAIISFSKNDASNYSYQIDGEILIDDLDKHPDQYIVKYPRNRFEKDMVTLIQFPYERYITYSI